MTITEMLAPLTPRGAKKPLYITPRDWEPAMAHGWVNKRSIKDKRTHQWAPARQPKVVQLATSTTFGMAGLHA